MRLRRSDTWGPGIRRCRHGRGFRYLDADGEPVRDEEVLRRIRGLVIPPAWHEVWICPFPHGHIQAVGMDAAGRRQYLYHEAWRKARDEEKHQRVLSLARQLPEFRARVDSDLSQPGLGRTRVLACALRILDRGVFRTGGEEYAEDNGTRGVATLLRGDVQVRRGTLLFRYPAKGGLERKVRISDPKLARLISALRRGRADDERLLVYRNDGNPHEVRAEDINGRMQEIVGAGYTAKDLRTWHATVLAAVAFAGEPRPKSNRARARVEATVMREVAEQLGNTPAVARRSYVDPRVTEAFEQGNTIGPALDGMSSIDLDTDEVRARIEAAVIELLSNENG